MTKTYITFNIIWIIVSLINYFCFIEYPDNSVDGFLGLLAVVMSMISIPLQLSLNLILNLQTKEIEKNHHVLLSSRKSF